MTRRTTTIGILAALLAALSVFAVWPKWSDPVEWTLDGLFYQERLLELRGANHESAHSQVFEGPISAELRTEDPRHSGNAAWIAYNEPFYERRISVPLAGATLYPVAGERSLLYVSLAGYVAAILALFGLLLLRFRVAIAAGVAGATAFLPALTQHSSYPITDSWGLALQIAALGGAIVTLDRGLRWLPLWVAAIALLGFTRDSAWIPVLAAGFLAVRYRSRVPVALVGTGVAAALPALLLFTTPVQNLLAMLVNDFEPSADTSWGFIASNYPDAVVDLVRANVGFLRRGEWYTALYLVGGVLALLLLVWRRPRVRDEKTTYMTAAAVLALGYVLAAPAFSAFRLELAFVPIAAWGLSLASELALERLRARMTNPSVTAALRRS